MSSLARSAMARCESSRPSPIVKPFAHCSQHRAYQPIRRNRRHQNTPRLIGTPRSSDSGRLRTHPSSGCRAVRKCRAGPKSASQAEKIAKDPNGHNPRYRPVPGANSVTASLSALVILSSRLFLQRSKMSRANLLRKEPAPLTEVHCSMLPSSVPSNFNW